MAASASEPPSAQRLQRLLLRQVERKRAASTGLVGEFDATTRESLEKDLATAVARHEPTQPVVRRLAATPSVASSVQQSATRATKHVAAARPAAHTPQPPAASPMGASPGSIPSPHNPFKIAPTPHLPVPVEQPQEDIWAALARQAAVDEKRSRIADRLERARKIEEQHRILDEQVGLRSSLKNVRFVTLRQEQQQLEENARTWAIAQKAEKDKLRESCLKLQADCAAQSALVKKRTEEEKRAKDIMEAKILERIQRELEEEKERQVAIKQRDLAFKDELISANEAQKVIKRREKEEERARDELAIEASERQLEKQEAARQLAWDQMKAKMVGKEVAARRLNKTIEELAAVDERRMIAAEKAREERELAQELATKAKARDVSIRYFRLQCDQVAERAERARRLEEEERKREQENVAAAIQRDIDLARADKERLKQKKIDCRLALEPQIILQQKKQTVVISEEELRLNRQLVEHASAQRKPPSRN